MDLGGDSGRAGGHQERRREVGRRRPDTSEPEVDHRAPGPVAPNGSVFPRNGGTRRPSVAAMSEELLQTAPKPLGRYLFYRLGSSTLRQPRNAGVVKGSFTQNIANKKPDGVVVLLGGGVKAIVEYKSPSELRTPEQVQVAIDQELAVARQLCKLLIVTSGNTTYWINALTGKPDSDRGRGRTHAHLRCEANRRRFYFGRSRDRLGTSC